METFPVKRDGIRSLLDRLASLSGRGDAAIAGSRETFNQFILQLQLSLGVHGAHKF